VAAVELEYDQNVAIITLNSPETRNALTPESSAVLNEMCDEIDARKDIGAAIVRGAGGTFCSGAARDVLARAGEDPAEPDRYEALGSVYDAFVRVGNLQVPTIAAVRGASVGAGVNLLMATDLRVVATNARIISGFTRIGIHPGGGHLTLLNRLVGREAIAGMVLFGEEVSGERAVELGLAWEAVPDEQVEDRALELARIPAADPTLIRRTLSTMRAEVGPPGVTWQAGLALERAAQMWSLRRKHVAPSG